MNHPEPGSLVLGGQAPGPQLGSVVLGGVEPTLGHLFERFNAEAKLCNGDYFRLELSDKVALVRQRKLGFYFDIKIKCFKSENLFFEGKPIIQQSWEFGGWLKHRGALFGCKAYYEPGGCVREISRLVVAELLGGRPC